jgi:pilus assembly protein Flp/PilA
LLRTGKTEEKAMNGTIRRLWHEEEGLETIEYAIIAGIIAVGVLATVVSIGLWVSSKFTALNANLQGH